MTAFCTNRTVLVHIVWVVKDMDSNLGATEIPDRPSYTIKFLLILLHMTRKIQAGLSKYMTYCAFFIADGEHKNHAKRQNKTLYREKI